MSRLVSFPPYGHQLLVSTAVSVFVSKHSDFVNNLDKSSDIVLGVLTLRQLEHRVFSDHTQQQQQQHFSTQNDRHLNSALVFLFVAGQKKLEEESILLEDMREVVEIIHFDVVFEHTRQIEQDIHECVHWAELDK